MSSFAAPEPVLSSPIRIGIAMKWVAFHREVDPLSGAVETHSQLWGASAADLAALELGLRLADTWSGEVIAVTAGPHDVEPILRTALAAGATRAVRHELPLDAPSSTVAEALAVSLADVDLVICGDRSLDRGSGSVPAFLAARLGAAQTLGLVAVQLEARGVVQVERRLGGGRRERLRVRIPAVISVESRIARLRRAPLDAMLRSDDAPVDQVEPPMRLPQAAQDGRLRPYRPRPRGIAVPEPTASARERILAITAPHGERTRSQPVIMSPDEAAECILVHLRNWGYLQ